MPGQGPQLSKKEKLLLEEMVEKYRLAGLRPPSVEELKKQATSNQKAVEQLIRLAEARGELVQVSNSLFLHADVEHRLREQIQKEYGNSKGFTVSQLREKLDISRKYAIPLCEYFDRIGFTHRNGDLRVLTDVAEG